MYILKHYAILNHLGRQSCRMEIKKAVRIIFAEKYMNSETWHLKF